MRCRACDAVMSDPARKSIVDGIVIEESLCRNCLPIAMNPDGVDWKWRTLEDDCRSEGIMDAYHEMKRNSSLSDDDA